MSVDEQNDATPEAAEWHPSVSPWLIAAAVVLCSFMEVLDTTIMSVALPHMAGSLSSTNEEATWVLTSYLVANGLVMPISGWCSIRFGRKRFLMACTAIFVGSSFLCAVAPSMGFLVLARILQGLGGGAMQPIAQAVLLESFPREKRGIAMTIFGLVVVLAPVIGPVLGGWLTDNYSWRWTFGINIPLGMVALTLMARFLEDPPYIKDAQAGAIDGIGLALLTLWVATLQIVLDKGQTADWFAATWIRWFSLVSTCALVALVVWELRCRNPIVDLSVFRNRNFSVGSGIVVLVSMSMYGSLTTLPLLLQSLYGYTAEVAGWATAPRGLGSLVTMILSGLLLAKFDGRWAMVLGIAGLTASTFTFGRVTLDAGMANFGWPCAFQGAFIGLALVPGMTYVMATLPNEKIGNASGVFNLVRNLAGSMGISISTTYLTRFSQIYQSQMVGNLTPYDPVYQQRMAGLNAMLTPLAGAPQAAQQAHGLMFSLVQQQAGYHAFMAVFVGSAILTGIVVFAPLLMKRVVLSGEIHMH
jgi:DHA2 family multidrug resistance protein